MPSEFCTVCGSRADHLHHIFPQHLGGPANGPVVGLCASHHQRIHNAATRLLKGKPIEDDGRDGDWLKRAWPLIQRIVQYTLQAENINLDETPRRLIIKLPREKLRRIHRRKADLGYKSLETYILSLIDRDLPP